MKTGGALTGAIVMLVSLTMAAPVAAQTIGGGTAATGEGPELQNGIAFGQTFSAPSSFLRNVSVQFETVSRPGGTFTFSINQFDTSTNVIGQSLYSTTFAPTAGVYSFGGYSVATTPGNTYAFLLTSDGAAPGSTTALTSATMTNPYAGGSYFYANGNGTPVSSLAAADLAFSATFASAAPEPSAWALMILGFGVVGYALRRRRVSFRPGQLQAA